VTTEPREVMWQGKFVTAVRKGRWEYDERAGRISAVVILAEHEGCVVLVEQFRVPIGKRFLELPAGLIGDGGGDDNIELAAKRELEEETGFVAQHIELLGEYYSSPGMVAESFGLVLTDLDLPDASGLQAVEALARSGEQLILVLTGAPDATLRARALEAGAYDFLSKNELSAAALERLLRLAAIQSNTYRSLRASEARFRGLVELSSDWYWEQDAELRFTRFEGRSDGMSQAAIGKRRWEVPGLAPVSCSWQEHRETLQARRGFRNFEYLRPGEDGEMRYISVSGEPLHDALGRFQGYSGVASDVTERKRVEEHLRRAERM
jgi:PAS domain S-box-containing protein